MLIVGLTVFISEGNILLVDNIDNGDQWKIVLEDDAFILGYTHSVLLTPAEEYFTVNEDKALILQKTVYESFGVGLPYEQENDSDFEIVDGKFILYLEREFKEINMVISPIPDHWIGVGNRKYELVDIATDEGAKILIHVEKRQILKLGDTYQYVF
jgi:hypothetical protein